MRRIAATGLFGVFEVVIPVGSGHELHLLLVGLHVEPREGRIETVLDAVDHRIRMAAGIHVCRHEGMVLAECEERTQTQQRPRMGVEQRVTYQQLGTRVHPQHLLSQDHPADTIRNCRGWRVLEIRNVLVTARLVDTRIAVQRQIERLIMLDDGFIQRREQYVTAVAFVDRGHDQTVILARIAADDGRTHIAAAAIRRQYLPLQGVFEIPQLILIKFQYGHIIIRFWSLKLALKISIFF